MLRLGRERSVSFHEDRSSPYREHPNVIKCLENGVFNDILISLLNEKCLELANAIIEANIINELKDDKYLDLFTRIQDANSTEVMAIIAEIKKIVSETALADEYRAARLPEVSRKSVSFAGELC